MLWAFCSVGRHPSSGGSAGAEHDGAYFRCGREVGRAFLTGVIFTDFSGRCMLFFKNLFLLFAGVLVGLSSIQEEGSGLLLLFIA